MRLIISFAALFLSVALLQLSSGGVGPLDALSGFSIGFTTSQIGLLGSSHFIGFFIGCWWAPRLMGSIGHSRAFAAFTALGAIGLLSHMMILDPYAWAIMRIASGLCVAGCYTVIEAWLQAKVTNGTRGRAMGTYRVIDMGASLAAQLVIGVLEPASYISYNLLAILCCASILPLTLTKATQPETPAAPRLRPALAFAKSPLAVAGVIVAGLTSAAYRMVGPIYGKEIGLEPQQIGYFLAAFVAGGALAQYPTGWLADKYDRRWVLIWMSVASIFASVLTVSMTGQGVQAALITSAIFGFTSFPIYSVASAHANDFATQEQRVELSAALMFFYAIGAIASPLLASNLISIFGPNSMFVLMAVAHAALIIYGLLRMGVRPTMTKRTRYIYTPRTSFTIGKLLRRKRDLK